MLIKITNKEADAVEELYEKKHALINLSKILKEDISKETLYNQCLKEYQIVENDYQKWWDDIILKYNLEIYLNSELTVNAVTKEIKII